jgi:hypothetical protein
MMPDAAQIRHAEIDGADFFFAAESEDFAWGHGGLSSNKIAELRH